MRFVYCACTQSGMHMKQPATRVQNTNILPLHLSSYITLVTAYCSQQATSLHT